MRKTTKPKSYKLLHVRLSEAMCRRLKRVAQYRGQPMTDIVKQAIENYAFGKKNERMRGVPDGL